MKTSSHLKKKEKDFRRKRVLYLSLSMTGLRSMMRVSCVTWPISKNKTKQSCVYVDGGEDPLTF